MTQPDPITIEPATDHDLAGIVEIANYTAATSIATFDTRPLTVR